MSAIIYETVNHYNLERGLLPYRYIGSDQHNKSSYLGSGQALCDDIKRLGKKHFSKRILCEFHNEIPNVVLRKIESYIQTYYDVANDLTYYNKTNNSHKGYVETDTQKAARVGKLVEHRKDWWSSLTEEAKQYHKTLSGNNLRVRNAETRGKTYEEIYGATKAELKKQKHRGSNNGMAKTVYHLQSDKTFETIVEAMKYYNIKHYSTFRSRVKKGEFELRN